MFHADEYSKFRTVKPSSKPHFGGITSGNQPFPIEESLTNETVLGHLSKRERKHQFDSRTGAKIRSRAKWN